MSPDTKDEELSDSLLVEINDRVALLTLNRPAARNALSSELLRALPEAIVAADANDDVDVIVLTGADPAFCAGLDLRELGSSGRQPRRRADAATSVGHAVARGHQAGHRRHQRRGGDRWLRDRVELRLPHRIRAREVRRHPRPRRPAAGLGAVGAAAAGRRHPSGARDEPDGQLHGRARRRWRSGS